MTRKESNFNVEEKGLSGSQIRISFVCWAVVYQLLVLWDFEMTISGRYIYMILHAYLGMYMYLHMNVHVFIYIHANRFNQTILSSAAWHAIHILAPPAALKGLESEDRICTSAMASPGRKKSPV